MIFFSGFLVFFQHFDHSAASSSCLGIRGQRQFILNCSTPTPTVLLRWLVVRPSTFLLFIFIVQKIHPPRSCPRLAVGFLPFDGHSTGEAVRRDEISVRNCNRLAI